MPHKILSCGEVLWDLFPEGPRFGGAPANFACHAALLGGEVSLASAVGQDGRGQEALAILRNLGVGTGLIQHPAGVPTGSVGVTLDAAGKPAYRIHAPAAWDTLVLTPALEEHAATADALYFGTLGMRDSTARRTLLQLLETARARGAMRVLDVNLRPPFYDSGLIREVISLATVLKLNDDELPEAAAACGLRVDSVDWQSGAEVEAVLRHLLTAQKLDFIALTCGAQGAWLLSLDETVRQPGIPAVVRDTVGAGDSFTAALTLGLLEGRSLAETALRSCQTASAVCSLSGAVPVPGDPAWAGTTAA